MLILCRGRGGALAPPVPGTGSNESENIDLSTAEKVQIALTPVIASLPWTAPIYRPLAKPVTFPKISGCIANEKKCKCFTQQATIVDLEESVCRMMVKRKIFDMFLDDQNGHVQSVQDGQNKQQAPNKPESFIKPSNS